MINNGFTSIVVTSSIRPRPSALALIMKLAATAYTPPTGDNVLLRFGQSTYVPPISVNNPSSSTTLGRGWHLVNVLGYDAAAYDAIVATGATTVRHAVNLTISGPVYTMSPSVAQEVTKQVSLATARGLKIVLVLAPPAGASDLLWTTQSLQDSLVDIWKSLALQFRGVNGIAFDLINEPNEPISSPTPSPTPAPTPSPAPAPTPSPAPAPTPSPAPSGLTLGTQFTTLSVTNLSGSGARPYTATVLPLRGQVPAGSIVGSSTDSTLRGTITATHTDGSASVIVVSGTASGTGTIPINVATGSSGTNLTTAVISAAVTSVSVNFGATYGTASISDFSTPERTWWTSPTTICARYRVRPTGASTTGLEVVIDIHGFAGNRAWVQIRVENARINSRTPVAPDWASYTSAVVSVNGSTIQTTSSGGAPEGAHSPFRAWYAETWIGGNPGLLATQAVADLQKHPLFWKIEQPVTADMSGYAADTYTPWGAGRHRAVGMGGTGDHPSIGPLPLWETHFLATGSAAAANAVKVSALSILGFNVNYREVTTGLIPDASLLTTRYQTGSGRNWPVTSNGSEAMTWEIAHHPAAGLMAFVCQPSPVFIEIAQTIAVWNGTYNCDPDALTYGWNGATYGVTDMTGIFGGSCQVRGKAWGMRSLSHATFLSPDGSAWKTGGREWLVKNRKYLQAFIDSPKAKLNVIWNHSPNAVEDNEGPGYGIAIASWMQAFFSAEFHRAASVNQLIGSEQTALDTAADWAVTYAVRWVNEQSDGGWRFAESYRTVISTSTTDVVQPTTWTAMQAFRFGSTHPASVSGPWAQGGVGSERTFAELESQGSVSSSGGNYTTQYWSVLVAAVERGVTGANTAYNTVLTNVTNLTSWKQNGANDPRWLSTPRVTVPAAGFGIGSGTGSYNSSTDVWTPARDGSGLVNAASYTTTPINRWFEVANTRLDSLDAAVKTAIPTWQQSGGAGPSGSSWDGVTVSWSGWAVDQDNARAWVTGGGHTNSGNNGIYRIDLFKMAWDIEMLPTDTAILDSNYLTGYGTGSPSFSVYVPKLDQAISRRDAGTLSAINDVFGDELTDGKPAARHTYRGFTYAKSLNKLILMCRRLWTYNLNTGQYDFKRYVNDYISSTGGVGANNQFYNANAEYPGLCYEGGVSTWDDTNRKLYHSAHGSNSNSHQAAYDFTQGTYGAWLPEPFVPFYNATHSNVFNAPRQVTYFRTPENTNLGPYGGTGEYKVLDLNQPTVAGDGKVTFVTLTSGTAVWTDGTVLTDLINPANGDDLPSFTYISSINRYWFYAQFNSTGYTLCELDPTTTPWSMSRKSIAGAAPNFTGGGLVGTKLSYFPVLDAVVMQTAASKNLNVIRFS